MLACCWKHPEISHQDLEEYLQTFLDACRLAWTSRPSCPSFSKVLRLVSV